MNERIKKLQKKIPNIKMHQLRRHICNLTKLIIVFQFVKRKNTGAIIYII
jgi:hypothetical protein